ncbi:colicin E3/pyocin S6 family cytotoxin [bacterium endosymbiont of Bathymodiolus sp. 5 South]|uniref:colicin E3/pyocin S6 family cytotoxin n=2 Tax=bacterium endosymbiont of Bathymodiolus sp. 5 South TaxID=1181670 RepID=UPI00214BCBD0|nr:colicin E3/pyocin S6 family cytotoxin [bacterium endosymbiont of Bathymodiolus sp. 5 South]
MADSQDNRKGHYGEDNNIYLNDTNLNNTKDLATTLGHETSHAIDNQDPSINTNPQNNTSKADNEIYAQNYGDDFSDYVEFASENYGDGNLADTNNNNLGNTPAERQRNQKLINNNNQDYAEIDKSKGEDSAIIRYATPVLKDPSLIIKIAENGLKAIGIIAGAEIVNQVSDSAQDDDTSDIPKIDDVSEVAGTGAPMPDGGGEDRKENPNKSESPTWKDKKMKNEGNGVKSTGKGKKKRFYDWDYTHNDIEVYDRNRRHLGSMNPTTGKMYKGPVKGRVLPK